MNIKTMKENLESAIDDYIEFFEKKHGYELDYWLPHKGEIACFGDFYFNFDDIRMDIEQERPEHEIFDWQDATLEWHYKGDKNATMNYDAWIMAHPTTKGKP